MEESSWHAGEFCAGKATNFSVRSKRALRRFLGFWWANACERPSDIVDLFQSLRARSLQCWMYIPTPRIRVVEVTLVHSFWMSGEFYAGKATNFFMLFMHSMWRFLSFSWQNEGERPFVKVDLVQSLRARALQTVGYNPTSRIWSAALRNPAKTNKTFSRRAWPHDNIIWLKNALNTS